MTGARNGLIESLKRRVGGLARALHDPPLDLQHSTDQWEHLGEVFAAALALSPPDRAAFIAQACADDAALRAEVQSLLAAHTRPGFLDRPAVRWPPASAAAFLAADMAGRTISHYRIEEALGSGGMGVVYRARDLRLERDVALKFLPAYLCGDAQARQRFQIEAQAAAALDHPNICVIHDVAESEDGQPFIAMAFYRGETLKQRIARGALPVADALHLALQVARGLEAAHERGIVHRDIKPGNLMLTTEGDLRIVDFGIAKAVTTTLTVSGMMPGTVAYMSPEQTRGGVVDRRTDLWSLGVVLFEMLAGERPFRGDHEIAVARAIEESSLRPLPALSSNGGAALEPILHRLLAKQPEDRYATAAALAHDLASVRASTAERGGALAPAPGEAARAGDALVGDGERRPATLVACHLSGYADLVERMDPVETERILERLRTEAEEVVAKQGGVLEQRAGDELLLRFGVPTAREDDAVRATRAALDLVERVRALGVDVEAAGGPPLRAHVGMDTGHVVVQPGGAGGYRIAGLAARTAAQLAAHAAAGEVWIGPDLQRLVGPFFETRAGAPVAVHGRAQPVLPHCVLRASGLGSRMEAASKLGLTAFTGRDAELAQLRDCLEAARLGEGTLVTVIGDAGLGKSRLLYEFDHELEAAGLTVLRGRSQSYGSGTAYLPFIDVLRAALLENAISADVSAAVVARVREIGAELEAFLPFYLHLLSVPSAEFPLPRHLQGEQFRLAIQDALAAFLTVCARRRPVVVLLEDWHWVDDASHATLKQVAELAVGYPLLIVVACRPGYVTDWGEPLRHVTIPLRPLEQDSSLAILKSVLRANALPDELAARLHERTGGNPFFLEEICHTLVEDGRLRVESGDVVLNAALDALELPDTVQAVIRARLDRIDAQSRETLRLASVVGREFTRSLLERTLAAPGRLPHALQTLKAAGLIQQIRVVPEAAYRFKHALTQEVAYGSLLERQRRELHGRVGAAIEAVHQTRIDEHLERLAHHFSRAEAWSKAVHYAIRSAERADALSQFPVALELLERAAGWLARLPESAEREDARVDILLRQERLCETLGQRRRQQRIIDDLIELLEPAGDAPQLAEVYLRQGDVSTLLGRFPAAEDALEKSLRIRREHGDLVGERNTLRSFGLLRWHEQRNAEALGYIEQALRIDRARGDTVAIVGDLSNLGYVLKGMGDFERAREHLEEGLRLAEFASAAGGATAGDIAFKLHYLLHNLANLHREQGDVERALGYLKRAQRISEEGWVPVQLSYHSTSLAHIHLEQGRVEDSLALYRDAVELTRRAEYTPGLAQSLRFLGELLLGLDRHREALPHLEEAARLFSQLGDPETESSMWSRVAAVYEKRGDLAAALAAWGRVRMLRQQIGDAAGELQALEGLARVTRHHVDEPSLALAYCEHALALAGSLDDPRALGRLHNTMGILEWKRGAFREALAHYEAGLALYTRAGDEAGAGLMRNSIGATYRSLGRTDQALAYLTDAVDCHRKSAQPLLEGHALALLGELSESRGDLDRAHDCYAQSLALRRTLDDRRGAGWMLCGLGRVHLARGDADAARAAALDAADCARVCGDPDLATACERLRRAPVS